MNLRAILALTLAAAASPACAVDGCTPLAGMPINFKVTWPQVWQRLNDEASCTQNCHIGSAPTGDLDLSSRNIAVYFLAQPSSQLNTVLRVDPGNPRGSLFFQKASCGFPAVGTMMPPPKGSISWDLQGLIYDWIEQGAYGENPEDPIPRDFMFRDSMESLRR